MNVFESCTNSRSFPTRVLVYEERWCPPSPLPELLPQLLPALSLSPTSQLNGRRGPPREGVEDTGQATLALCLSHAACLFHNHPGILCPEAWGWVFAVTREQCSSGIFSCGSLCYEGMCPGNLPGDVNSGKITSISAQICQGLEGAWGVQGRGWGLCLSPEPAPVQGRGIQPSTSRPHCYPPALTQPVVWVLLPPSPQAKSPSGAFGKKLMLIFGIVKNFMSIFS